MEHDAGQCWLFTTSLVTHQLILLQGTLSDFWKGSLDPVFPRTDGPFLTRFMWSEALSRAGYEGNVVLLDYFADDGAAAVIVATAVGLNLPIRAPLSTNALSIVRI